MATLLLTRGSTSKKGVKKKTLQERVVVGANTLVMIIIALICLVSVSYLIQSNKSAAKGYVLKELQEEEKHLQEQSNFWALKISRARSLKAVEHANVEKDMHDIADRVFMKGETKVALRKE